MCLCLVALAEGVRLSGNQETDDETEQAEH